MPICRCPVTKIPRPLDPAVQLGGLHTISEMLRAQSSTAQVIIAWNNTPAPSSICPKTAGKTAERSMGSALLKTSTSLRRVRNPNTAATQSRPQNCSLRRLHLPHCPFLFDWQHPAKSIECSHPLTGLAVRGLERNIGTACQMPASEPVFGLCSVKLRWHSAMLM